MSQSKVTDTEAVSPTRMMRILTIRKAIRELDDTDQTIAQAYDTGEMLAACQSAEANEWKRIRLSIKEST